MPGRPGPAAIAGPGPGWIAAPSPNSWPFRKPSAPGAAAGRGSGPRLMRAAQPASQAARLTRLHNQRRRHAQLATHNGTRATRWPGFRLASRHNRFLRSWSGIHPGRPGRGDARRYGRDKGAPGRSLSPTATGQCCNPGQAVHSHPGVGPHSLARLPLGATATSTVARGRRGRIRVPLPTVASARAAAGP